MAVFLVALGGALGALARWGINLAFGDRPATGFPWATSLINISGCFVIGLFLTLSAGRFKLDPAWTLLVATGFCGAFTTFSTFAYETQVLVANGAWPRALLYVLVSNGLGFAAVLAGVWLGKAGAVS